MIAAAILAIAGDAMVFRYTLASLLLGAGVSFAHDIWLVPDSFVLAPGDTLVVHQMLGEELAEGEEELPLFRRMTPHFELVTPEGSIDLLAGLPSMKERPEIKPVLERRVDFEGLALVTMEHSFLYHEMTEEKFLEYLHHEQLDEATYRRHMGHGDAERERYARVFKTLVQVGNRLDSDLHRRALGQKLEILLLQNPYRLSPGDTLDVQVLFDGQPLPDQRVAAHASRDGAVSQTSARTNNDGVARFTLDRAGAWLLRLVHLIPCAELEDGCEDVEWESYWASFSFEVAPQDR